MTDEITPSSLLGKIAAYTEILQKDPNSTIFVSLSEAYRKMGHLDDARQIIEKGLHTHPDFSPGYVVLARILCQQSDYDASKAAFRKVLELDANSLAGLVGFARLSVLMGATAQARNLLLQARSLSPADPIINKFLSSLTPEVKEQHSEKSDSEIISAPLVSETLADLYLKQGMPDKALEVLRELLRTDPDNLELRRRIRDTELVLTGESPQAEEDDQQKDTSTDKALNSIPVHEADEDIETSLADESQPEVAVENVSESQDMGLNRIDESGEVADPEMSPLEVLTFWLGNIQKRRVNV